MKTMYELEVSKGTIPEYKEKHKYNEHQVMFQNCFEDAIFKYHCIHNKFGAVKLRRADTSLISKDYLGLKNLTFYCTATIEGREVSTLSVDVVYCDNLKAYQIYELCESVVSVMLHELGVESV